MARAIYQREPTAQEMAAVGLMPGDFEPEVVEVWPDNLPALDLWDRVATSGAWASMDRLRWI
ncbi:hypothetical protein GCM10010975_13410 [Comamonas phosphati]|nr:hypothetical protein GCM10010975_13410 [Comamonas phosphati]